MKISMDDSIKKIVPNCRLGCVEIHGAGVKATPAALTHEFAELKERIAQTYDLAVLPQHPRILSVRDMYRKLRFDPSRYRPASEALMRRVLQQKQLYFVNSAVDVINYCSLKHLLPMGLYDLDRIEGDAVYRVAAEGNYVNIGGNEVSTEGKPFLADSAGVFGNPTSDSRRTAVTLLTRNLLLVVYAAEEVADDEVTEILQFSGEMLVRYNGGRIAALHIVKE